MAIEVKVPQLPESVSDATLIAWQKGPGDAVKRDESIVNLETDKVVLDVPAPVSGVIREIRVQNGTTVRSGDLLAVIDAVDEAAQPQVAGSDVQPQPAGPPRGVVKAGPAARHVAAELGVNLGSVTGSGRDGRVLKSDITAAPPAQAAGQGSAPMVQESPGGENRGESRGERRVSMSRLRARIAQRMVEAQQNAAMLTTFNEVDLGAVMALRNRYRDSFEKQHGVKLGFMSFFVKATIEALRRLPGLNASVEGNDIVYHDYYDIGIAVSTDRGLIVPVVRDADSLSFAAIETAINDYGRKAREGSISMEELTGGTFTITNGGVFGSLLSTPIINPPQSGILGMHKIQERPVAIDGAVVVRPMMYVALTYDHRIIDGREAVQFLVVVKDVLEDPARLLLQL